jgi:hypothetical protein
MTDVSLAEAKNQLDRNNAVTAMLDKINPITRETTLSPPFPSNRLIGSAAK